MRKLELIENKNQTIPWKQVFVFAILSAGIIMLVSRYYQSQKIRIFEEQKNNLTAISVLKSRQIQAWCSERLADAEVISDDELLLNEIQKYIQDNKEIALKTDLLKWMSSSLIHYDYSDIFVVDSSLKLRIVFKQSDVILDDTIRQELKRVLVNHRILMSDIQKFGPSDSVHMDILIPILHKINNASPITGILILRINPSKILFPLIRLWPTPSKSSETLLIKREGDSVRYLNNLRKEVNTDLSLRLSTNNNSLLATKAAMGFVGFTEGVDYKNVPVVGYIAKVPGSSWFLVTKTDKEELQEPLKRYFIDSFIIAFLLLLVNACFFAVWIWNQRIKITRAQVKNEERFRSTLDHMIEGCQIIGYDWRYIYLNDAADVHNRRPKKELLGKHYAEMWPGVNKTNVYRAIKESLEERKYHQMENEFIFPDGSDTWFDLRIQPVPEGVFILSIDITARKKSMHELGESEKLFRNLFENMLNGFAYCKMICEDGKPLDFIYLNVNEAFATLTGLKDVVGKKVSEAIPGIQDADPELLDRYNRVSSTGIPEVFETFVESLKMWFSISVYSPQKGYFVAVFDVITARKIAEEKLIESRATLQGIIDNSNSLIYLVDAEGQFVMVNKPLQELLSPTGEQMLGQTREAFLPKDIADLHRRNDKEVFASGRTQIFEEENIEPDGKHYYLTTKFPLYNNHNDIYAVGGLSTEITERKRIEKTLKENEERFRSLYENVSIGIYRTTVDGQILMANPAMVSMLGFESFDELTQRNLEHEGYEPDYPRSKFLATMREKGKITGLESIWNKKDGEALFVRENANAIRDDNGKILYFDGTVEDISEQKKAEEALRESEDKFKYVFDHSVIGKSITFLSGEIHVNKAFCEMVGYSPTELESIKWQNITYPDDIERTEKELQTLSSGEKDSMRIVKRYVHKDGSVLWTDLSTSLRRDAAGNPLYFMTSVIDITELKKAEEILRTDEKRLRDIIDALPQLYWTCRADGPCDYLSTQWVKYTGIPETEQLGYGWLEQVHNEDRERTISEWKEKVKTGESFDFEFRIRRADGEYHWFQTRAVPIRDPEGTIQKWLGSNTDIDSIRKAETQLSNYNKDLEHSVILRTGQLEAANKELESFSYSVSHDLRAPLRAVHGYTNILLEDFSHMLDDEGRRICGIISGSATQMGELIDDLLSFSRIGRSEISRSAIDMKKMAGVLFEGMTSPTERERIKLKVGKLQKTSGDVKLMGQVWTNLISNAIKYTSKNEVSEILIGSSVSDKMITYFIKDNGVGFDMQYGHKLFGVFQRLHSESEFEGNGVGLAIVQRIILKHGGKVWAEGEVGKGATFYFSLPLNGEDKLKRKEIASLRSQ